MFVKGIEASLWWAPKTWTVRMDGEERSVVSVAALAVGMLSAQIVMCKIDEIAQKMSAARNET
jgi:hypothetical protein